MMSCSVSLCSTSPEFDLTPTETIAFTRFAFHNTLINPQQEWAVLGSNQ
jgi:hypothetical protein